MRAGIWVSAPTGWDRTAKVRIPAIVNALST
jgi:hypothetical protein